jgi:hypothetical protein
MIERYFQDFSRLKPIKKQGRFNNAPIFPALGIQALPADPSQTILKLKA